MRSQVFVGAVLIFLVVMLGLIGMARAAGQAAPAAEYKLTEVQTLKLKVAQQEVQLRYTEMQMANNAFQGANSAYNDVQAAVKKENNWPDNLTFDARTLTFHAPPAAPVPAKRAPAPAAAKP